MAIPDAAVAADAAADAALEAMERNREDTAADAATLEDLVPATQQTPVAVDDGPEAGVDPQPATPGPMTDYRQKYETLAGKYKAEVPRLIRERDAAREQAQAAATAVTAAPAPAAVEEDPSKLARKYLKDQEVEDFGEDLLEMHSRLAKGVSEAAAQGVVGRLEARIQQLESERASSEGDKFWDTVDKALPGAVQTVESDPLFSDFLDTEEPVSGRTYRALAGFAVSAGDAVRMAEIVRDYQAKYQVTPDTPEQGAVATEEAPRVKPPQSNSRVVTPQGAPPVIRKSTVQKFYNDVTRGAYEGKEELRQRREEEIDAAFAEGRIIPG